MSDMENPEVQNEGEREADNEMTASEEVSSTIERRQEFLGLTRFCRRKF